MYKRTFRDSVGAGLVVGLCCRLYAEDATGLQGGTELTYVLDLSRVAEDRVQAARKAKEVISKRLETHGQKEVGIAIEGEDRLVIRLPRMDAQSLSEVKSRIERGGDLEFRLVAMDQDPKLVEQYEKEWQAYIHRDREWVEKKRADSSISERRPQPPKCIVRSEVEKAKEGDVERFVPKPKGKRILENFHPTYDEKTQSWVPEGIVSGDHLDRVDPILDQITFQPAIAFQFTGEGADRFSDLTGNSKGRELAFVLDDDILQVATIREQVKSAGQLSGKFSDDDVKRIVAILTGGSLKTRPRLISERTIEPVK